MSVKIKIPKVFQYYMKDKTEMLEVNGSTVGECLDILVGKFPELKMFIYKEEGLLPTEWVESASNMLQVLFYQGLATYGSL